MANQSLSDLTLQLQKLAQGNANKLVFDQTTITESNNYLFVFTLVGQPSFTVILNDPVADITYSDTTKTMTVKGNLSLYGLETGGILFTMTGEDVPSSNCHLSTTFASFPLVTLLDYKLVPSNCLSVASLSLFTFDTLPLIIEAPGSNIQAGFILSDSETPVSTPIPLIPELGLSLSKPGLIFTRQISPYGDVEASLTLTGTVEVGPMVLQINLILPVSSLAMPDIWSLKFVSGSGDQAVSLENLIQVLAGNNPFTLLPSSLSILGAFSLLILTVDFDFTDPNLPLVNNVFVNIGTGEGDWPVVTTPVPFDLTNVGFSIMLTNPFSKLGSNTTVYIYGGFIVGKGTATTITLNAGMTLDITTGDWVASINGELGLNGFEALYASLPLTSGQSTAPDMPSGMDTTTITLNYLTIGYNASATSNSLSLISFSIASQNLEFPIIPGIVAAANPYANFTISNPTSSSNFQLTGIAGAQMLIGNVLFNISAAKPVADGGWIFSGSLDANSTINLSELVDTFMRALNVQLPNWILSTLPKITELSFQITTPPASDPNGANSYSISGVAIWSSIDFGLIHTSEIEAAVSVTYNAQTKVLTGSIFGFTTIDDLIYVKIGYTFAPDNKDILLEIDGILCIYNLTTNIITISFDNTSLGSIITNLMGTIEPGFQLTFPWNFLNDIDLSGLSMTINLDSQSPNYGVSLSYNSSINLGFLKINSFTIAKTKANGVTLAIDGSFLGISTNDPSSPFKKPQPLNNLPPVPGQGNSLFSLNLLAVGQHVGLKDASSFKTVTDVITALGNIEAPSGTVIPFQAGSNPGYDPNSNWLIATDFGIFQIPGTNTYCIAASAVFNDPNIYGLQLTLSGDKMKFLSGLSFEILYKKISDTVGLYQMDLTLPSAVRNLNFGEFNIVIPSLGLQIYTNGDFLVDIGFPYNLDFSRSFTVNAIIWVGPVPIPVIGSAGFYFGKLSSATCPQVPQSSKGTFNPVIVFGIGAQIGFGYTADYGILSAGFSLTALGILEGIIATWQPYQFSSGSENQTDLSTSYYFWIKGTVGVMGKLWGTIDFSIIKATVDITISATVSTTYESYMPMPFSFTVRVSVTLSVKINLGLFSITIHFSFKLTISESLTIGSDTSSKAPWYDGGTGKIQSTATRKRLHATYRSKPLVLQALTVTDPEVLIIYFIPHLTVTGNESGSLDSQVAKYVAMLYMDTAADGETPTGNTSFEKLAIAIFNWVTGSYVSGASSISAAQLADLYQQLCNTTTPIDINSIMAFLQQNFILDIQSLNTSKQEEESMHVTVFPMLSALGLSVPAYQDAPAVSVNFENFTQCDSAYIQSVQEYFSSMMMQPTATDGTQKAKSFRTVNEGAPVSVNTIVVEDYFVLIARQLVKDASDAMEGYQYKTNSTDSLNSIVELFNAMGTEEVPNDVTIASLTAANDSTLLGNDIKLLVYGVQSMVISGDTCISLAVEFGLGVSQLAVQNESVSQLLNSGVDLNFNGNKYTTTANETFTKIATAFGVTLETLASTGCSMNDQKGLLSEGVIITAGTTQYKVVDGDTLSGIATKFSMTVSALSQENSNLAQLLIPASPVFYKGSVYLVQSSDTLATVAARFGTDAGTMTAIENSVFSNSTLLTSQTVILIAGAAYQVQAKDTLTSIQTAFQSMANMGISDMLLQNCFLPNLILAGVPISVDGHPTYTTLPGDTFNDIINAFPGVSLNILADSIKDINNLLRAQSFFCIPPMVYNSPADNTSDTLRSVAAIFQTQPDKLTSVPANQQLAGIFSVGATCKIPDLQSLRIDLLSDQIKGGGSISQASGMVSRYLMHGLRLPLNQHIQFSGPSPCGNADDCSLYNLTGQQFMLPSSFTATSYSVSLTNANPGNGIAFNGSSTSNELTVTLQVSDENTIENVLGFARTTGVLPQITRLIELPPYAESGANFTFRASVAWQPGASLQLPTGGTVPQSVMPEIWSFPSGITQAINADKVLLPIMIPFISPGGDTENAAAVSTYGWGTLLNVTIRRSADAPNYCYELVGADETGTQLLENLLSFMNGQDDHVISSLAILYPDSGGSTYLSDGNSNILSYLLQSNLSTVTNPPQSASFKYLSEESGTPPTGILNSNFDFLKLLWECSITRSGGFNMYYNVFENGTGFPDKLFQDSATAVINIMVLYQETIGLGDKNQLYNFMNSLVTGISIDPSKDIVYAQSQRQTTNYSVPDPEGLTNSVTIAAIISQYNLLPSDLILDNPDANLTSNGLQIAIPSVYYQMKNGDTLESIATYFSSGALHAITAAQLQNQNPGVTPATWVLLYIGDITLVTGTGGPAATIDSVLNYYGITPDVFSVANLNLPGLFANGSQLTISDQLVSRTSVIPAGSAGYWMSRITPADVPVSTTDPAYPNLYLQNAYNQLAATVLANDAFKGGVPGMPVGPSDNNPDLSQRISDIAETINWEYSQAIPLNTYAINRGMVNVPGLPDDISNPYAGVGNRVQINLDWRDLFGNFTITPFSNPQLGNGTILNNVPVQIGYTDNLIPISAWPSATTYYVVNQDSSKNPQLQIGILFDKARYTVAGSVDAETAQQNAEQDLVTYTSIYYQLCQVVDPAISPVVPTLSAVVSSTLLNSAYTLNNADFTSLLNFVQEAYLFLAAVAQKAQTIPPAPTEKDFAVPLIVSELPPTCIFEIIVSLNLIRPISQVHDDFKDVVAVWKAGTAIQVPTMPNNANINNLSDFAGSYETTLFAAGSQLKIATGMPDVTGTTANGQSIWSIQWTEKAGKNLSVAVSDNPFFYAVSPLGNYLQSDSSVPVYPYTTGQGINWTAPQMIAISSVDMDNWAFSCLSAIETLLSAQYAAPMYLLAQIAGGGADYLNQLLGYKQLLADAIIKQVTNILATQPSTGIPLSDAQNQMYQQLLNNLTNAYTINAVIQFPTTVSSPYPDIEEPIAPNVFGVAETANIELDGMEDSSQIAPYSLSTSKIALDGSTTTYLTFMFNVKAPGNQTSFSFNIKYQITHLEHNIQPVPGIKDYKGSQWLNFVIQPEATQVGDVTVPVLLRAYPTPPSVSAQTYIQSDEVTTLQQARMWDYTFTYSASHEAQDSIDLVAEFNLAPNNQLFGYGEEIPNLLHELTEFTHVFAKIQQDLTNYLPQITKDTKTTDSSFINAQAAVLSFLQLIQRVSNAWPYWKEAISEFTPPDEHAEIAFDFEITERPLDPTNSDSPLVLSQASKESIPAGLQWPLVAISDYTSVPETPFDSYEYMNSMQEPLEFSKAQRIPNRKVTFTFLDILQFQNAWASVSLKRNAELLPGIPTNPDFIYQTPYVSVSSATVPLLNYDTAFNIATMNASGKAEKATLIQHMVNLFSNLFLGDVADKEFIQLGCTYYYPVNSAISLPDVQVPVLLATPFYFVVPSGYQVPTGGCPNPINEGDPFVCLLTGAIEQWYLANSPITLNGRLVFSLALFSKIDPANQLPILQLNNLELNMSDILNY